jgi:hypothetical protein
MKFILLITSLSLHLCPRAQEISFQDYFPLKTGSVQVYTVSHNGNYFNEYDPEKKICRSELVKGTKVFYLADAAKKGDTSSIGPEAFVNGVFFFSKGNFMFSPVYWKYELKKVKPEKFRLLFPKQIRFDTVYVSKIDEETRKYKFTGFETTYVEGAKLDSCLKLEVEQIWPSQTYKDIVWFKKATGVVKWQRSTGRLEELQLPKKKK